MLASFTSLIVIVILCNNSSIAKTLIHTFTIEKPVRPLDFGSMMYLTFLSPEKLCLGTPYQCLQVQFNPGQSLMMVFSKTNIDKSIEVYNPELSSTYQHHYTELNFYAQKLITGNYSTERLKFGLLETDPQSGFFFKGSTWIEEQRYSSIGLSSKLKGRYTHFVQLLYQKDLIEKCVFTIEIFDKDNGRITFGEEEENELNTTNTTTFNQFGYKFEFEMNAIDYYVNYFFEAQKLLINGNTSFWDLDIKTVFDEAFGFIQFPYLLKNQTTAYFLTRINCTELSYRPVYRNEKEVIYTYYLCPRDEISRERYLNKHLTFAFNEGNMTLRNEDLFIHYSSDKDVFAIIFRMDTGPFQWIIGQPILKHYMIKRDVMKDTFTFYSKIKSIQIEEETTPLVVYFYYISSELLLFGSLLLIYAFITMMKKEISVL